MSFQARVERECGKKLKVLRTDNGSEFTSVEFGEHCAGQGIQRHFSAPYTPQQNGVVKHRNQMVVSMARSILRACGMLGHFWGEAVHTTVFLLNQAPTAALNGRTPNQAWYGKKPAVHFLKVFGCVAYIKRPRPHLSKLEDRGQKVVFIGYQGGWKVYRFYDLVTERVHISRDAVFDESTRWDWGDDASTVDEDSFTVADDYKLRHPRVVTQVQEVASPERRMPGSTQPPTERSPSTALTPSPTRPSSTSVAPQFATPPLAGTQIEFVTPLSTDPSFDADCWGLVLKCYELRTRQHRKC
jgi:transposase InsO family protein